MKNKIIINLLIVAFLSISTLSSAQVPPPPPPDPSTGENGPIGGSAAVGAGLGTLLILGALYGGNKLRKYYLENKDEEEK